MYHLQPFDKRINGIAFSLLFALLFIVTRLLYLQVKNADHYYAQSEKNFMRIEQTPSQRGAIFDCNGALLATNRPVTNLVWHGSGNRALSGTQLDFIAHLEKLTHKLFHNKHELLRKIQHAERYYKQTPFMNDLSIEQLSRITEQYPEHPNIRITTHFQRHYPHGTRASHILGYLSRHADTPNYGQMGLEKWCNELLKGQQGTLLKTINSVGRNIVSVELEQPTPGNNIHTTLDLKLQEIAEQVFPPQYSGSFIIMDPKNGALRAIISRPDFDPALFLRPISSDVWQELQDKKPFLNRALNPYPPGSIFKLVTVSAALEHNFLHPNTIWNCNGFVQFAKRKYWCHHRWGHGELNTVQAVAQSCNVLFYEIGKKIDIDLLSDYAARFGLGKETGFFLPERTGVVPSREWKMQNLGEQWWPGETLSVTIGQSFLLTTPLQVARMIGSIFTGHLAKPRILVQEPIETTPLLLKPETINFLQESMRFVVTRGTGKKVNAVKDVEIYAKTSTAQVADFKKRNDDESLREHAWFVAHFQYKEMAPLVFVILVENAGSSQVATSIAKRFLIAYKDYAHQA